MSNVQAFIIQLQDLYVLTRRRYPCSCACVHSQLLEATSTTHVVGIMAMDVPLSSSNTSGQDDPADSCSSDRDINAHMVSEIGLDALDEKPYSNSRIIEYD